jgi:hyperosmotically inducible periplasmic protein
MKPIQHKGLMVASSFALLLGLSACDRADDRTTGQRIDSGVSTTRSAANEVKRDARDATASAGAAADRAAQSTREMGAAAADKTQSMGATAGDKVDDATITTKVNAALAKDKDLSAIKIDVDTQNGVVTLSGPAPTATAKQRASEIARTVKGVSSVNNQLTVKAG